MIGKSIVCLASIAWAGTASAQISVHELEQRQFEWEFADLVVLDQGDLLLRMRERRDLLYLLAPDGKVKERSELPSGSYGSVAPYRNGFVIQRFVSDGSRTMDIVAYESPSDVEPKVLYQSTTWVQLPRVSASPDGRDLYVVESNQQTQITRIDASGQIAWQKAMRGIEQSSFVATDDGVVFAKYVPFENPARALRALDREGQLRWEIPLDVWDVRAALYSAAGFITLLTDAKSDPGRRRTRLVNFDVRTGERTADRVVAPFFFASGTKHGLLIGGQILGQAHVATLDRNGEYAWQRRYVPDNEVGDVRRGTMGLDSNLVFITRGRVDPRLTPMTSVVVTDGTATALATVRGGCLNPDWKQANEAAKQLELHGILIETPTFAHVSKEPGCTDRETHFMTFVKQLWSAARGKTDVLSAPRRQYFVRVTAAEPIRLEKYSVSYGGITGGGTLLEFAAPYDGATAFWKTLSEKVIPHLDRMQALEQRFMALTRCGYGRDYRGGASIDEALTGLENAAKIVNARVASIAPEELAAVGSYCGASQLTLRRDSFGSGDAMLPLEAADRTVLDVLRRNREAEARGDTF
jgi:hypothetical protein